MESGVWAPFTHFNMNSHCSSLNSPTLWKRLTHKWTKFWKRRGFLAPKSLCSLIFYRSCLTLYWVVSVRQRGVWMSVSSTFSCQTYWCFLKHVCSHMLVSSVYSFDWLLGGWRQRSFQISIRVGRLWTTRFSINKGSPWTCILFES